MLKPNETRLAHAIARDMGEQALRATGNRAPYHYADAVAYVVSKRGRFAPLAPPALRR